MEKRKAVRRKTGEIKSRGRGIASDAESTVSTRSSNSSKSNDSNTSWKQRQRRLKAQRLGDNGDTNAKQKHRDQVPGEEDANAQLKSLEARLGAILETTEAQVAMIVLTALDVGCTAVEIHLHDQHQLAVALQQVNSKGTATGASTEVVTSLLVQIVTRLVESFTGFTLFLFLIELVILVVAFRRKFFAHAGYVLDSGVVITSLAVELYAQTKAARLLGVLRVWRVLRLVRRLMEQERAAHDTTLQLLEQEELKLLHVRMQKDAAHESLKREYESRAGLEKLLRGYKDEIMTLKEALQIAAQAVAEATMLESPPVGLGLYEYSDAAVADNSYPAVADKEYGEEYYEDVAAVHPTELQNNLEARHWQDGEESEYYPLEAAVAYPEVGEKPWRESHHKEDGTANLTEVQTQVEAEHRQKSEMSEIGFEDAVDQ